MTPTNVIGLNWILMYMIVYSWEKKNDGNMRVLNQWRTGFFVNSEPETHGMGQISGPSHRSGCFFDDAKHAHFAW